MSYVVPGELVNGAFYFNDSILLSHRAWIFPLMSFSFKWQLVFSVVLFKKLHPWRSLYELQRPSTPPASASGPSWPGGQNLQTLCVAGTLQKKVIKGNKNCPNWNLETNCETQPKYRMPSSRVGGNRDDCADQGIAMDLIATNVEG